ncbi:MAG: hypothetical protein JW717_10040 [Marinilabiliaceae bacterium]|nr:hypothetical protein [Marinilabiliaceae bacterium]
MKLVLKLTPLKIPLIIALFSAICIAFFIYPVIFLSNKYSRQTVLENANLKANSFLEHQFSVLNSNIKDAFYIGRIINETINPTFNCFIKENNHSIIQELLKTHNEILDIYLIYKNTPSGLNSNRSFGSKAGTNIISWQLDSNKQLQCEPGFRFASLNNIPVYNITGQSLMPNIFTFYTVLNNQKRLVGSIVVPMFIKSKFTGVIGLNILLNNTAPKDIYKVLNADANFSLSLNDSLLITIKGETSQKVIPFFKSVSNRMIGNNSDLQKPSFFIVDEKNYIPELQCSFTYQYKCLSRNIYKNVNYQLIVFIIVGMIFIIAVFIIVFFITYNRVKPIIYLNNIFKKINTCNDIVQFNDFDLKSDNEFIQSICLGLTHIKDNMVSLKNATNKVNTILEAIPDLLFEIDKQGYIHEYHVPKGFQLFLPPESWKGKPITELLPDETCNSIFMALADAAINRVHRGTIYSLEIDGNVNWYELSAERKGENIGVLTRFIVLIRDVSKWKKMEQELIETNNKFQTFNDRLSDNNYKIKKINKELINARDKTEESNRGKLLFWANMSNEIRTPITDIMGITELLIEDQIKPSERIYYQKLVQSKAEELMAIINDILDISQIKSGSLQISETIGSINNLFTDTQKYYDVRYKDNIKCDVDFIISNQIDWSKDIIATDFLRLKQVIFILIDNAFKYTFKGNINVGCRFDEKINSVIFWIKDTGIGINIDLKDKVFSTSGATVNTSLQLCNRGSVLSLSIAKGIVEQLNGKIWFDTEVNNGTTFYFTIPYKSGSKVKSIKHIDN